MLARGALAGARRAPLLALRGGAGSALAASRGALAPLAQRAAPLLDTRQRDSSSKAALAKMGTLSVDPLADNTAVQGVEYVLTGLDRLVNWARKSSMWPMTFGLA